MSKWDVLLAILNFRVLSSLTNNAKISTFQYFQENRAKTNFLTFTINQY